ncbi:MAG: hypothetical protein D6795_03345, partial [Deltaproteobacteria bacterium]
MDAKRSLLLPLLLAALLFPGCGSSGTTSPPTAGSISGATTSLPGSTPPATATGGSRTESVGRTTGGSTEATTGGGSSVQSERTPISTGGESSVQSERTPISTGGESSVQSERTPISTGGESSALTAQTSIETISGGVAYLDRVSGRSMPLSGFPVFLEWGGESSETVTDPAGTFTFERPPGAPFRLHFEFDCFQSLTIETEQNEIAVRYIGDGPFDPEGCFASGQGGIEGALTRSEEDPVDIFLLGNSAASATI